MEEAATGTDPRRIFELQVRAYLEAMWQYRIGRLTE